MAFCSREDEERHWRRKPDVKKRDTWHFQAQMPQTSHTSQLLVSKKMAIFGSAEPQLVRVCVQVGALIIISEIQQSQRWQTHQCCLSLLPMPQWLQAGIRAGAPPSLPPLWSTASLWKISRLTRSNHVTASGAEELKTSWVEPYFIFKKKRFLIVKIQ